MASQARARCLFTLDLTRDFWFACLVTIVLRCWKASWKQACVAVAVPGQRERVEWITDGALLGAVEWSEWNDNYF